MNVLIVEAKDLTAEKFEQLKAAKEKRQKACDPLSSIDCKFRKFCKFLSILKSGLMNIHA